MDFRIIGGPTSPFAHLFGLSDAELAEWGAVRRIADALSPGYPCRISLTDSRPGDELPLVNYEHHAVATPYRMRYAVYVRSGEETYDEVGRVPEQLRIRALAARALDAAGRVVGWELAEGSALEPALRSARPLYAARVGRA